MIKLITQKNKIELESFTDNATLTDLAEAIKSHCDQTDLITKNCYGCGGCCNQDIPVLGFDLNLLQQKLQQGLQQEWNFDLNSLPDKYFILPDKTAIKERNNSIKDLKNQFNYTNLQASLIYEFNQSEPIILSKKSDRECLFLEKKLCKIFSLRPFICSLYICNAANHLAAMLENIVRQGTWHAYYILGWIEKQEINHNPFLKYNQYKEVLLKDFDTDMTNMLSDLFFYF